jgi:hypothetical protein
MPRINRRTNVGFRAIRAAAVVFATMIAAAPISAAVCSNVSLKGVYGYFHGRPGGLGAQPVDAVQGQITADGAGHISSGSFTLSSGGTISTGALTGTYSISKSCTGTLTFNSEDQSPADFNIVLDNSNKGFQMIQTDVGNDQPGFGLAEGTVTCGLSGKKLTLATNFIATLLPGDVPEAIVGQVTLDGKGNLSGMETQSDNGSISTFSVTGTYTENADCTGTARITPSGGSATNFNTVVVNAGKELLLFETDNGSLAGGNAQASPGTCSNASLKGIYGYFHGRPGGIEGTAVNAVVGQIDADGTGNITSGSFTWNEGGGTVSTGTFTGTYSIGKNCSGTLTLSSEDDGAGSPVHFNVALESSKGFQMIQTDSGNNQPGFGVAQGTVTCGLSGKKQVLATSFLATDFASSDPESIVGQVTLDGKGNLSGTETFSVNYVNTEASVTGTYTENANCTGTAQVTPSGGSAVNFNTVVVSGGKELLMLETDSNTLLGGTAQQ